MLAARPKHLVADQKYGTTTNFRILKVKGINPAIVPQTGTIAKAGLSSDHFVYDRACDIFIFPTGNILKRASTLRGWKPYQSKRSDCSACSIKEVCIPSKSRRIIMAGPKLFSLGCALC